MPELQTYTLRSTGPARAGMNRGGGVCLHTRNAAKNTAMLTARP